MSYPIAGASARPYRMSFALTCWLLACLTLAACTEPGARENAGVETGFVPASTTDSIAAAHGFGVWDDVGQLDFAFAVDVSDTNRVTREWSWFPREDSVVLRGEGGVGFRRSGALDSAALAADADFINDSYWLLMPFYLVWSEDGYERAVTYRDTMPLSGEIGTKVTVQYRAEGGYTPGDAYDLYVGDDYRLREWVFRKGGQPEPSMVTDWSGYETSGGIVLPTDHRGEGPVRIYHPSAQVSAR